jgi:hypothetical protein
MSEDRYGLITNFQRAFYPAMPRKLPEGQELFRLKEAAPYFDVHYKTLLQMIDRSEVVQVKHSERKRYIKREEILHYWQEKSRNS